MDIETKVTLLIVAVNVLGMAGIITAIVLMRIIRGQR